MKTFVSFQFCLLIGVWFLGGAVLPAATIIVTDTLDDGLPGCFRWAITNVNAIAGSNNIHFNIPGPGPHTIRPLTALPLITANVLVDGYTQPGASSNSLAVGNNAVLMIELNGTNTPGANTDGLQLFGPVTIRGLIINRFRRHGIDLLSFNATSNGKIQGCFIGTDTSGMTAAPNGGNGVTIAEHSFTVGGTNVADRNVISGNSGAGIAAGRDFHIVQNNYIGTDKTGTNALGNAGNGIAFSNTDAGSIGSTNNPVAGRNVISGNGGAGIDLGFDPKNSVVGNYIGTDASGISRPGLGNVGPGVVVGGNSNIIGGMIAGHGNVIAGNGGDGVRVDADLEPGFFTNGWAISILGNSIYANGSAVANDGNIGIDLSFLFEPGGVTTNDTCDVDFDGGNRYQNFPTLTSATSTSSNISIAGNLDSTPNTTYLLECFASSECDPGGFGEGEMFIGRTNLTAGGDCTNGFSFTFPVAVANGKFITATASRVLGGGFYETSEFSVAIINAGSAVAATPPYLTNLALLGGALKFGFTNASGATFTVLATTNPALPPGNWTVLGPATESPPGQFQFTDPQAATDGRRFYRARSP